MDFPKNIKLLIFDFDGTLHALSVDWQKVREVAGIANTNEPLGSAIERLKKENDIQRLQQINELEKQSLEKEKMNPDIKRTLQNMQAKFSVAILSRNSSEAIKIFLDENGIEPLYVVGREDTNKLKPDPSGVHKILQHFNAEAHEAILVGDTYHDVEVAKRSGLRSIIISNSQVSRRPTEADFYIGSISNLNISMK
jgi:HAD superfamily hydrolase (TIGR01549 family)